MFRFDGVCYDSWEKKMSRIQTLIGLLRLLKVSDGQLETRIRIQKETFLLGLLFPDMFNPRDFEYHYYGPYSRGLSETLQFAVSSELVEEIDESPQDRSFTKFSYLLTEKGTESINALPEEEIDFSNWAARLKGFNWRVLELTATTKFLEINEQLEPETAFAEALRLKPATLPYKKEAKELLQDF